eukprot:899251-Amphidinium_carterae.1
MRRSSRYHDDHPRGPPRGPDHRDRRPLRRCSPRRSRPRDGHRGYVQMSLQGRRHQGSPGRASRRHCAAESDRRHRDVGSVPEVLPKGYATRPKAKPGPPAKTSAPLGSSGTAKPKSASRPNRRDASTPSKQVAAKKESAVNGKGADNASEYTYYSYSDEEAAPGKGAAASK